MTVAEKAGQVSASSNRIASAFVYVLDMYLASPKAVIEGILRFSKPEGEFWRLLAGADMGLVASIRWRSNLWLCTVSDIVRGLEMRVWRSLGWVRGVCWLWDAL